jgi:DNA-binding NarL/FixJ family response regulator
MDAARWPLIGRDAACEEIVSALAQRPARSVVIAGPAGVGRTRLARETAAIAHRDGRPVRWAAATGPAAHVPLSALAHLIPAVEMAPDPFVLLQRATQAIVGDGSGPAPVLAVDDVHLLDQLSITWLHQLAAGGAVTLILTVRTDGAVPDPVASLWKDGLATRIDVAQLGRGDMERLVVKALEGEVATRMTERLWQLTQGNPLFLREVLDDGRTFGRLRQAHGIWRWEGPMTPSQRLVEIVLSQIGDLDYTEWRTLEVLATAEPLSAHNLVELGSAQAVASLQRRGVIIDHATGGPGQLRVAHPMYAAVVRSRASEANLQAVRRQLVDAEEEPGTGSEHPVRRCIALLDSDLPVRDADLLLSAARHAIADLDVSHTERLARAALDAGGGFEAHLLLLEAVRWLGEPEHSLALAVDGAALAETEADRARLTTARVLTLFCALGRAEDATSALRDAVAAAHSDEAHGLLQVTEGALGVLGGDPRAMREATETWSSLPLTSPAGPLAAASASLSLALTGQPERALAVARAGRRALETGSSVIESLLAWALLAHAEVIALQLAEKIEELDRRTEDMLHRALAAPEWAGDAIASLHCGAAALASGRWRQAVRWLEEALSGLERRDPVGMRGLCCSLLAVASTLVSDVGRARQLIVDRANSVRGLLPVFEPFDGLAEACLLGVEGRTADAGERLLKTAEHAAALGHSGDQALLLHWAAQAGRAAEVAAPLLDLAQRLDSPLVADLADHAQALALGDSTHLEEVSRRLEEAGALTYAADCAAAAAAVHERRGARGSAVEWTRRAMALAQEGGITQPPILTDLPLPTLTSRENEVARLASRGLSNQAIADELVVSVRTVETHLSHAYAKLGIASRADLAAYLAGPGAAVASGRPVERCSAWPIPM